MNKAELLELAKDLGIDINRKNGDPKNVKELKADIKAASESADEDGKMDMVVKAIGIKTKKAKQEGYIDEKKGTILFTKDISPTQKVFLNNKTYMLLSDTVMRDQQTGEHYKIVKE